jgi:anaerobic magnesium-protoporphyrin IX monomethyl ester cyclase
MDRSFRSDRVVLLFPPTTDPRNPHLSLPCLAASLRQAGIEVDLRDLDLECLLWLLDPEKIVAAARACFDKLPQWDPVERDRATSLLLNIDELVATTPEAPRLLRDPDAFYDPHVYRTARETISRALDLVSLARGRVRYNVAPVRYDVLGRDPARLSDLLAVTAEESLDIFRPYYLDHLLPGLEADPPAFVGISILNHQQALPGLALARLLKERGHFVILGGTVYTKFVDRLLELPAFFETFCDGLVAYEGETAALALLDELDGGRRFEAVPNLITLDGGGRARIGPHHLENVDALPTPDFDGLPLADYLAPELVLPLLTGKGCYFNRCKFCDIPFINRTSRKAYRIRSPEEVAADVATLHARHGVRHFEITDEALAPRLLLRLGEALDMYPDLDARFTGFARFEPGFTSEVCERLHEIGFRKLFFGLESGSQTTLDHMEKGIKVEVAERVLASCRDAGIAFHIFSMIGFPEEREEAARETVDFFVRNRKVIASPANSFDIHRFTLDLRTEYGEAPERFGVRVLEEPSGRVDFPLSVETWENPRGMDGETIERLLVEFSETLHHLFRARHPYPAHLWPDWAPYSSLYADRYAALPFGFRAVLPDAGDPLLVRLLWNENTRVRKTRIGYHVCCVTGEGSIDAQALEALSHPEAPTTVDRLLDALRRRLRADESASEPTVADVRALVDALLLIGVLRLEVAEDASEPTRAAALAAASVE